jgi:hypothetical protein
MPKITSALLLILTAALLSANDRPLPVAIYSRVAPSYERQLDDQGKPEREFYAIGYGGRIDGTLWDQTQSKEDFPEIAGIIAQELAKQNYYFSPDKATADLLVVIHWGRTNPFNLNNFSDGVGEAGEAFRALNDAQNTPIEVDTGSAESAAQSATLISEQNQAIQQANDALNSALSMIQMESREQTRRDEATARVIGYTDELRRNNDIARFAGSDRFDTLRQEVQDPRYYVVVTAYDFDEVTADRGNRKPDPEWVTRFSIRTRGNDFMDKVDQMALKAGDYFGRDSGRLIRDYQGEVQIGELQVVGTEEASASSDED